MLYVTSTMYMVFSQVLACFLAVAAAAPVDDTPEVAAAKASFKAAFDVAEAGEHIALAPVNNDVQAAQIANAYLDDVVEVADVVVVVDVVFVVVSVAVFGEVAVDVVAILVG